MKQLIVITAADHVSSSEASHLVHKLKELLLDTSPGFRVLTDLSLLKSTDPFAIPHIGSIMDLLAAKQVGQIVRVVPDQTKDVGLNILSRFHYGRETESVTYDTLADAIQSFIDQSKS